MDQTAVTTRRFRTRTARWTVTPTQAVKIADALGMQDGRQECRTARTPSTTWRAGHPQVVQRPARADPPYTHGQPTFQRSYPERFPAVRGGLLGSEGQALGGIEQTQDEAAAGHGRRTPVRLRRRGGPSRWRRGAEGRAGRFDVSCPWTATCQSRGAGRARRAEELKAK
ncbi:hypothetical protein QJS66_05600 [Kocuria rhizophila]|nr:hypothetical protein QJS66_05600 [Kocuria rhizophila]